MLLKSLFCYYVLMIIPTAFIQDDLIRVILLAVIGLALTAITIMAERRNLQRGFNHATTIIKGMKKMTTGRPSENDQS